MHMDGKVASLGHYAPAVHVHGSSSWISSFQPCCSEWVLPFLLGTMDKVAISNGCP